MRSGLITAALVLSMTAPASAKVWKMNVGGVSFVTCFSFDISSTSFGSGFSPSRFFFEPLCVNSPIEMTG